MKKRMEKYAKIAAKMCVSGLLVYLLIKKIDWLDVMQYLDTMNVFLLTIASCFYVCGLMISAKKWHMLAKYLSFTAGYFFYVQTYIFGTFLNNFFPSFVGGDAYRIFALGKKDHRVKDASVTIVVDRLSGLYGTMILALIFSVLNINVVIHNAIMFWIMVGLTGGVIIFGALILFFHTPLLQKVSSIFPYTMHMYEKILMQFRSWHIATATFFYTTLFSLAGVACVNYTLFLALGIHLHPVNFLSVIFLSSIIAAAPVSIGNIGIKEWAYVFLFGFFGVSSSAAVAVVLLSRVLQMMISLTALPGYFCEKKEL